MTNRLELLNDDIKYIIYKKLHQLYMKDIQKELIVKAFDIKYPNNYKILDNKNEYYKYCVCCSKNRNVKNLFTNTKDKYHFLIIDENETKYDNDDVVISFNLCKKCKNIIKNYDYVYIKNLKIVLGQIKDVNSRFYKLNNDFIVYI